jgi:lipopolysaccharide transport system permease protein
MTSVVFVLIFSRSLNVGTEGIPPFLYYFCGLMAWNLVANALSGISLSMLSNSELCKKLYFPRIFLPLTHLTSAFFSVCVQMILFLPIFIFFIINQERVPNPLLPIYLMVGMTQTLMLSLGLGLWVAALTAKYRDFHYLLGFGLNLWMYLSPIAYGPTSVPLKYQWILRMNPLSPAILNFRTAFFDTPVCDGGDQFFAFGIGILLLGSGLIYFNRIQKTISDVL